MRAPSSIRSYLRAHGLRLPAARAASAALGPFNFSTTVTAGAVNLTMSAYANLIDPQLRSVFLGNATTPFSSPPYMYLVVVGFRVYLADNGKNYSVAQLSELRTKLYAQFTVAGAPTIAYNLGQAIGTEGLTPATATTAAATTLERFADPPEDFLLPQPIVVDLTKDTLLLATSSAITGPPTDTGLRIELLGYALDLNKYPDIQPSSPILDAECGDDSSALKTIQNNFLLTAARQAMGRG